jgi:hypothetical protein
VDKSDLFLLNNDTHTLVPLGPAAESYSGNTATWTFPGFANQVLPDANYQVLLFANSVTDVAGNQLSGDYITTFFVLAGDANHDRAVDTLDFNALAANFGGSNKDYSQADFNYDGVVDTLDFNTLAANFGHAVPASAGVQSSLAPAAATPAGNGPFSSVVIGNNDREILDPAPNDSALPA